MAKKTFTALVEGDPIASAVLNINFSNLADVVNTVDATQLAREGISWDNCYTEVSEITTGTVGDHPLLGCVQTSSAARSSTQSTTFSATATATALTDGTNTFILAFEPAVDSPHYTIESGDAVRYWFGTSALFYNNTGTEAIGEYVVFYPQFRFTVGGVAGAWLDNYPTPVSDDFIVPAAFIGGALQAVGAVYQTVRTGASDGRGPGAWRSISLEGICPVTISNVEKIEIRIVGYGVGTTPTDLRVDITSSNFQAMFLRKCYDV